MQGDDAAPGSARNEPAVDNQAPNFREYCNAPDDEVPEQPIWLMKRHTVTSKVNFTDRCQLYAIPCTVDI